MVAASSDSIHVGKLQNAFGAIAVGRGAIAINFSFGLVQRVVIGKDGGDVAFDPRAEVSRPPLTPPHPHGTEPELGNLIGRHAELQALLGLFQQTCTGTHGGTVWITGEPGMGRNALGRRFVQLVEEAEPAPDLHRRTFTLLTLLGRFWIDPDPQQPTGEPHAQDVWGEWSAYIRRSFPRSSAAAGSTWISLMSQLASTREGRGVPPGLRDEPASLLAFLRQCLQDCDAGLLTLENVDDAPDEWIPVLEELARETARDLKLVVVATIRSDRPIQDLVEDALTPLQRLALTVCRLGIASSLWLGPIEYAEFENCFPDTDEAVREALYRLTDGVPLWVEAMWEDWKDRHQVERGTDNSWHASEDFAGGNAGHYVEYLIRRVLHNPESEFEFTADEIRQVLGTAALEGPTFTLEAVATATDFHPDDLVDYFTNELGGPVGLLRLAPQISLEQEDAGLTRSLRRFRFAPLGGYYVFLRNPTNVERQTWAYRLCDALERAYWPFPERIHYGLARLFELGGTVDPDGSLSPERQAKRNQRMSKYALIAKHRKVTEHLERAVDFWRGAGDDVIVRRNLWQALHELALRLRSTGPMHQARNVATEAYSVAEALNARYETAISLEILGQIDQERGEYETARHEISQALAILEDVGSVLGRARCLYTLGRIDLFQNHNESAYVQIEQALALSEHIGDRDGRASSLYILGRIEFDNGQLETARDRIEVALALYEQLYDGNPQGQANCLLTLGQIDMDQGDLETGRGRVEQALRLHEQSGDLAGQAGCMQTLGKIDLAHGNCQAARLETERGLALFQGLGELDGQAGCLLLLGQISLAQGRLENAREQIERSMAINTQIGDGSGEAHCLQMLGHLELSQRQYDSARGRFERALLLADQTGDQSLQASCLYMLGQIHCVQNQYDIARERFERALVLSELQCSLAGEVDCLQALGGICLVLGDLEAARVGFGKALALAERLGDQNRRADCVFALGQIAYRERDYRVAFEWIEIARPLYEETDRLEGQANCLEALGLCDMAMAEWAGACDKLKRARVLFVQMGSQNRVEELDTELSKLPDCAT